MQGERKTTKKRPNLVIQVDPKQETLRTKQFQQDSDQIIVKPLRSAKNIPSYVRFKFDDDNIEIVNTQRKMRKLKKLEREKDQLMRSIQILKNGAISAIAEKQEQIQKLKGEGGEEGKLQFYQTELQKSNWYRRELEDQRKCLQLQMQQQRRRFVRELQEKEEVIENLYHEIQQIRRQLSNFEYNDQVKTRRIRCLQEQNSQLFQELQNSTFSQCLQQKQRDDSALKLNFSSSIASSIQMKSQKASMDHIFENEIDQSYFSEQMRLMQHSHQQQITSLTHIYQKKIKLLRDIYSRQFMIPTQENQKNSNESHNDQYLRSEKSLSRNASFQTRGNLDKLKSVQGDGSVEKGHNLKYEIKMQELSQCPSVQRKLNTNEDAESQFTAKYFDNPYRFLKKNKSYESFKTFKSNKINEEERETQRNHAKREDDKTQAKLMKQKVSIWKQSTIFTAGLLSGATLTSLVGFLINRSERK